MHATPLHILPHASAPPVRLTEHEKRVWYELSAHEGQVVHGADLLEIGWGPRENWNDPDPYQRNLIRNLVRLTIYTLRRLLEAHGGTWRIATMGRDGYLLERTR